MLFTLRLQNVYFLKNEYQTAKNLYRNCIKLAPKPLLEAYTLNNLACTAWYHSSELDKTKTIPELTPAKEQASKDKEHVIGYFKEAIEKLDKLYIDRQDIKRSLAELQMAENIYSNDDVIPKDFSPDNEEQYFGILKSPHLGKALTNISEFLLETEGMKGQAKVSLLFASPNHTVTVVSSILVQTWSQVL